MLLRKIFEGTGTKVRLANTYLREKANPKEVGHTALLVRFDLKRVHSLYRSKMVDLKKNTIYCKFTSIKNFKFDLKLKFNIVCDDKKCTIIDEIGETADAVDSVSRLRNV